MGMMNEKNVVVDFSYLGVLCGFGSIAAHYSRCLAEREVEGLHFVFIVPEAYVGRYGSHVDYLRKEHLREDAMGYGRPIDLWHATTQTFDYRRRDGHAVQLLTVHDLNFLYEKRGVHRWKSLWRLRRRVGLSDAIAVISNFVKADLSAHVGLAGKPVEVIYNGVDRIDTEHGRRPAFVGDDGERFFFTIGQVLEKKGFGLLVPMMRHFPDHKLYICGDTECRYADTLQGIIDRQGAGRCVLAGRVSEAEKAWLYGHCEAFLFASQSEGFGLPVVEAMQAGCPVFLSRSTCLPEIGGRFAYYWDDCHDAERMAETVRRGLADFDAGRMADERAYALSFSYERYTDNFISLYKKLLS